MFIYFMVFIGGFAALSWELLWQVKASLALGSSAWGTAVILSVTMGGMCLGSLGMGHCLKQREIQKPILLYGALELLIGLLGLSLNFLFQRVEIIDNYIFSAFPDYAFFTNIIGITIALLPPTLCMGATIPVLGLIARQFKVHLSTLYGLNTIGAAAGVISAAIILIPSFGLSGTMVFIAILNIAICFISFFIQPKERLSETVVVKHRNVSIVPIQNTYLLFLLVFVTGFCTFVLEISWFRMMTSVFHSTTDAFAIMLSVFLLALGGAAACAQLFKILKFNLGILLGISAILVFAVTPLIERLDYAFGTQFEDPFRIVFDWFLVSLYTVGLPIFFLGIALPWVLSEESSTKRWSQLYSLNTFGAILGAILTAWFLLPTIGPVQSSLLAGFLLLLLSLAIAPQKSRTFLAGIGFSSLFVAFCLQTGIGTERIQGYAFQSGRFEVAKVLESYNGPDSTVSAVEYVNGGRGLVIDGFLASIQQNVSHEKSTENYMAWMGYLPMLLHPDPKNALVICMGTGQTLNAVRKENPQSIDIVDISPRVFELADNFTKNENVLDDPRVNKVNMDGRAFIRRSQKTYDVITLEPMPPSFAGVNALYAHEFYSTAKQKMGPDGVIAQWLPFHLMATHYMSSIVRTFVEVFPNSILWVDPVSKTGILLGSKNESIPLGSRWPGYDRTKIDRNLDQNAVIKSVMFDRDTIRKVASSGEVVTDDNQLLAYGEAVYLLHSFTDWQKENMKTLDNLKVTQ